MAAVVAPEAFEERVSNRAPVTGPSLAAASNANNFVKGIHSGKSGFQHSALPHCTPYLS